jgi:hypothetical protein
MRRTTTARQAPGVWQIHWDLARLHLWIWRAHHRRRDDYLLPWQLADAHRRLAKLYGSLLQHRPGAADARRAARLREKADRHAAEACWYGHLGPPGPAEGGRPGGGLDRRPGPRDLDGPRGVRHPRGPCAPVLPGAAEAEVEEDVRVRAVASTDPGGRRQEHGNDSVRTELR